MRLSWCHIEEAGHDFSSHFSLFDEDDKDADLADNDDDDDDHADESKDDHYPHSSVSHFQFVPPI